MIPKRIFSIWLNPKDPPELIQRCLATHKQPGFEHVLITLENYEKLKYVKDCLSPKSSCIPRGRFSKAADFLRMWYLNEYGGIYLDADVEVIKPLDDALLQDKMFVCSEENQFVSNAIVGSEAKHPILQDYLGRVERNFKGTGDLVFQPGMFLWTEIVRYSGNEVKIYPPDYFLPYNHHLDRLKVTDNTYTIHHFSKSWVP